MRFRPKSSNIFEIRFDTPTAVMEIDFRMTPAADKVRSTYAYWPMTEERVLALANAPSVGEHFARFIRPDKSLTVTKLSRIGAERTAVQSAP